MKEDRIFVRAGWRHYRRRYSVTEFRLGLLVVACLVAITAWVAWMGAHPEPGLYDAPPGQAGAGATADRGPLPEDLAPTGWREAGLSDFDSENLYVKINGRADYYKSFGFNHLYFLTLASEAQPDRVIDLELFDQAKPENALGAYEGERSPGVEPELGEAGLWHLDRNALFLTRGRYYARAISSEESEEIQRLLLEIRDGLERGLPAEPLPWSYALFVGGMGLGPGAVSFQPENAFSFGFARDVHVAQMEDGETEVFLVACSGEAAARQLALQFTEGFLGYGEPAGEPGGTAWVKDRYIATVAGAKAVGSWVIGVRGAPGQDEAARALAALEAALDALPPEAAERARESASAVDENDAGDGYTGSEDDSGDPESGEGDYEI